MNQPTPDAPPVVPVHGPQPSHEDVLGDPASSSSALEDDVFSISIAPDNEELVELEEENVLGIAFVTFHSCHFYSNNIYRGQA